MLFKTPMQGDARLALTALFSGRIETVTPIVSHPTGDAMVQTWRMRTLEPLAGQNVLIDGLQNTMTDALVRVVFANGNTWTARLTPSEPSAVIPDVAKRLGRLPDLCRSRQSSTSPLASTICSSSPR